MKLGSNWFYRPRIDVELKQYETLAFERYLKNSLDSFVYFEPYKELCEQVTTITTFLQQRNQTHYVWNRKLTGFDFKEGKLNYKIKHDVAMDEVEHIATFMLSKVQPFKVKFDDMRYAVQNALSIEPVGIHPVYKKEGWLLFEQNKTIDAFYYQKGLVLEQPVQTWFYKNFTGYNLHPVQVKLSLMKEYKDLPNPATWFVRVNGSFPIQETVIPIVVEKLDEL